ncbi:MAG: TetR/AcrR family transcriptional regulator [Sporolactobacillus sp.]
MDRRQQKTRDAIFKAFRILLSTKSYTRITIQEIIDEANIGRSTFYSHFETKDDLLKEMCTDLFSHFFSEHLGTEKTHDFSLAGENPRAMVVHILYHLRDNKKNIVGILYGESSELFLRFFKQYLNELIIGYLLIDFQRKNKTVPEDFLVNHIAGSFVELVNWWMKGGMRQTPEEMASYFLSVIIPII